MANKNQKFQTPIGTAKFINVVKPRKAVPTAPPSYSVSLVLNEKDPAAAKLISEINSATKEAVAELIEAEKDVKKKKKLEACKVTSPLSPNTDKEGNEIAGEVLLVMKNNAEGKKRDGQPFSVTIPVFDSKMNPINVAEVGWGSRVRCSFEVYPYAMPGNDKIGLSTRLRGVQVIDLKQSGGQSAEALGFDAVEGGYEQAPDVGGDEAESIIGTPNTSAGPSRDTPPGTAPAKAKDF